MSDLVVLTAFFLAASASCPALAQTPEGFAVIGGKAAANPYLTAVAATSAAPGGKADQPLVLLPVVPSAVIPPDSIPADLGSKVLTASDCPGQYGPLTFLAWSAKGGDLAVAVTDLAGPGGKSIGGKNIDMRVARYVQVTRGKEKQVVPLLLESAEGKSLPASGLVQVWLTYFIPPGTPAGTYKGTATVAVGEAKATLPIELTVYPFSLAETDVRLYVYYSAPEDPKRQGLLRKQLIDQRCHGMNCSQVAVPVTQGGDLVEAELTKRLDEYKAAGFENPAVFVDLYNRITAEWLNTPDKSINMYGTWFRYYPFSERLDKRFLQAVRTIRDEANTRGLKIILSVADEPGSHPWTTDAAQHYNDLVKKDLPDVTRELTVGGGWAMTRDEDQLWKGRIDIWSTNRWLSDKLDLVRKGDPNAVIQVYNMAGGGSSIGGTQAARLFYGFFNWKAQAGGAAQWCYYHSSTPQENYTWPAEDPSQGNVPTLHWEAVRDGAKDRRYLATLEELLKANRGATGAKAAASADAVRFLREISDQIRLTSLESYDPISGGRIPAHPPGTYEQWRARIAEFIVRLQ